MTWKYKNIPKIAHFYWGKNTKMSFLQFLTLKTFKELNPDWIVKLSVPKDSSSTYATWTSGEQKEINLEYDFFDDAKNFIDILNKVNFNTLGFPNNSSEIHKSDFIRLYLLATDGGLWSDMDIIYLKPMKTLQIPENTDLCVAYGKYNERIYSLIGFMLASKSNDYYKFLLDNSLMYYEKESYQSIGADLVNKLLPNIESVKLKFPMLNVCHLSMDIIYSYDPFNIEELITPKGTNLVTNETIGVHWYNGDSRIKDFIKTIDPYNIKTDTILGDLIKQYQL